MAMFISCQASAVAPTVAQQRGVGGAAGWDGPGSGTLSVPSQTETEDSHLEHGGLGRF